MNIKSKIVHMLWALAGYLEPQPVIAPFNPALPVLVCRLGSRELNWVPSSKHFHRVASGLRNSGLWKRYNIIVTHAFCDLALLPMPQTGSIQIVNAPSEWQSVFADNAGDGSAPGKAPANPV